MSKILREKKHFFSAIYYIVFFLLITIVTTSIIMRQDSFNGTSNIIVSILFTVLYLIILFCFIQKVRTYIQLCILERPIAIIDNKEIRIYSTLTGSYTAISWERISKFDTYHSKTGNYCFPVYINKKDEPNRFIHYIGLRKDCFRFSYTEYPEDEQILALLDQFIPHK